MKKLLIALFTSSIFVSFAYAAQYPFYEMSPDQTMIIANCSTVHDGKTFTAKGAPASIDNIIGTNFARTKTMGSCIDALALQIGKVTESKNGVLVEANVSLKESPIKCDFLSQKSMRYLICDNNLFYEKVLVPSEDIKKPATLSCQLTSPPTSNSVTCNKDLTYLQVSEAVEKKFRDIISNVKRDTKPNDNSASEQNNTNSVIGK